MSYTAYIAHPDTYKDYFSTMGTKRKQKDFYVIRPAKTGHGDIPVVTVAPTQSDVARAHADVQRDRQEHMKEVMPVVSHLAVKRRKNNNNSKPFPVKKRKV